MGTPEPRRAPLAAAGLATAAAAFLGVAICHSAAPGLAPAALEAGTGMAVFGSLRDADADPAGYCIPARSALSQPLCALRLTVARAATDC
jgi:hypothetical protein